MAIYQGKQNKQPSENPRPRACKKHLGKQQRRFVPHLALLATSGCPVWSPTGSFANRPACFISSYGEWSWRCEDEPISTCCQDGIGKWLTVLQWNLTKMIVNNLQENQHEKMKKRQTRKNHEKSIYLHLFGYFTTWRGSSCTRSSVCGEGSFPSIIGNNPTYGR